MDHKKIRCLICHKWFGYAIGLKLGLFCSQKCFTNFKKSDGQDNK